MPVSKSSVSGGKFTLSSLPVQPKSLPTQPPSEKQVNLVNQQAVQPKPLKQTGPLAQLPADIQMQVFMELNVGDRMKVGQTCKEFYTIVNDETTWKLECEKTLQFFGTPKETYKKHYQEETSANPDRIYYVVGENIQITNKKGFSAIHTTPKKKVDKEEILKSFPSKNVRIYLKKEDAEEFAKSRVKKDHHRYAHDTAPAVFEVKVKQIPMHLELRNFRSSTGDEKIAVVFNTSAENITSKLSAEMTGINQKVQLEEQGNMLSRAFHSITGKR